MKRAFVRKTVVSAERVRWLRDRDYVVHDARELWIIEYTEAVDTIDLREDPIEELDRVVAANKT